MGQKDIHEKILESHNDVFSDIVNVLLFDGEEVLKEEELEEQAPRTYYKADGRIREIERDVAKRLKKSNIRIACIGLENQTKPDADMALRIIGYDGAEYRAQLNLKNGNRYPVITLVLYFGLDKRWDKPLSLKEALKIPEKFEPFVNDYKVHLFEIAWLTKEQVSKFKSDFRAVADYFVQMRETGTYTGSSMELKHVQETLSMLSVMTGDHRFEDVINDHTDMKGESKSMSEFLERLERTSIEKGIEEGMKKGREKGIEEGMEEGMKKGMEKGMAKGIAKGKLKTLADLVQDKLISIADAARKAGMSENDFIRMMNEAVAGA